MTRILFALLLLAGCCGCVIPRKASPAITWLGCPMVAAPTKWSFNEGCVYQVEIGLRPDGTVVWRQKP